MTGNRVVAAAFDVAALPGYLTKPSPAQPIPLMVRRFQRPHCTHRRAKRAAIVDHIGRCWRNPDARGCLTCAHYNPGEHGEPEVGLSGIEPYCERGVSLEGRPWCSDCAGLGGSDCSCGGDGAEVKPGPVVHCDKWEASA